MCKSRLQPRPQRSNESKNSTYVLDLVYCDMQGPISNPGMTGARYFIPLLDDASGLSMVRLTKKNWYSTEAVKEIITQMDNLTSQNVKHLRGDNASELLSNFFPG